MPLQVKEKKIEMLNNVSNPTAKSIGKEKSQEPREYLNVFESDDEEFLSSPVPKATETAVKATEPTPVSKSSNPPQA